MLGRGLRQEGGKRCHHREEEYGHADWPPYMLSESGQPRSVF